MPGSCRIVRQADRPVPWTAFRRGGKKADVILFAARDRIVEGGVFYNSPEEKAAEADINQAFKAILNGGEDYAALREACERWKLAATSKPGS